MGPQVAKELENHLGVSDKTLAEFVIELSNECKDSAGFAKVRGGNGAAEARRGDVLGVSRPKWSSGAAIPPLDLSFRRS